MTILECYQVYIIPYHHTLLTSIYNRTFQDFNNSSTIMLFLVFIYLLLLMKIYQKLRIDMFNINMVSNIIYGNLSFEQIEEVSSFCHDFSYY